MTKIFHPAAWRSLFLLSALFLTCSAGAIEFPELTGRVVDEMNLLSRDTKIQLSMKMERHERETSNQMVVVVLKSLRGLTIEDYGYQLGRAWGIGQKDRNNGVILIIAPNERKMRIEIGYGLEGALTDAQSHLIIQNVMAPRLREGKFDQAVLEGTDAILGTLAGTYKPMPVEGKKSPISDGALALDLVVLFFGIAFLDGIRPRIIGSTLTGGIAGGLTWLFIGGLQLALGAGIIVLILHLFMSGSGGSLGSVGRGTGGRFGGGGFGGLGGGGSGGGFSGGGGSFGGGGASGSW